MEVSGQLEAPAPLLPGKDSTVRIGLEAGWAPEPVQMLWTRKKSLAPAENWTRAVQPVSRPYID
jgi:hypothetical protein